MIAGIGIDIVETERVARLSAKYGERFARRILTADELLEFDRRKRSSSYLATRFAAKEAVAKALGCGIGEQLSFHSIQIDSDSQGKPLLRFLGSAVDLIADLGINNTLVSLSDERHYVVAMVVLES